MPLAGGTHTGTVSLNYAAPQLAWLDSTQSNGAGRFRWIPSGGSKILQRNTATAGDFSSTTNPLTFASNDVATFAQRPVFGANTPWDSGNFTPGNYLPLSGGVLTGSLTLPNGVFLYGKDSSGTARQLIHMSSDNYPTWVNSYGSHVRVVNQAYNAEIWTCDNSGNMWAAGNVSAYSDERVKTDWKDFAGRFVEEFAKVKAGTYTRKDSKVRQVGVSAQSLRRVMPEAVSENKDGMLSVAYGHAALAAAVALARAIVAIGKKMAAMAKDIADVAKGVSTMQKELASLRLRVAALEAA